MLVLVLPWRAGERPVRLFRTEDGVGVELLNHRKDGSTFWREIAVTSLQDANGWYTHWVAVQRDVIARHLNVRALEEQPLLDAVTDLPNRHALGDRIALALGRLRREEGQLALLFCDLNHCKQVNDTPMATTWAMPCGPRTPWCAWAAMSS